MADESRLRELRRESSERQAHPEGAARAAVPRPPVRWKTRVFLPGAMLLTVAGLLAHSAGDMLRPARRVRVVPVVVKAANEGISGGGIAAQAPGWVEPWPFAVSVPALADGVVQEVLVLEGQPVEAGQIVARLIDADARIALARSEAELAQRQAEVAAAKVAAGCADDESAAVLGSSAELTRSPEATALTEVRLDQQQVALRIVAEQSRLTELRTELAAKTLAAESGVISSVPADLLKARVEAQEAEIKSLQVQEKILSARGKRLEVQVAADLAKAQAAFQAAHAAWRESRLRLERMEVRAPASGVVMTRNAEPGTAVMTGASAAPVVRLYDPNRLQVRVDVPLSVAAKVGLEQEAEIVVDVLPDRVFRGKVLRVVHEADIQRNTLQFKVAIEEPSAELKPEMLARVRFLVPREAAQSDGGNERVFAPVAAVGSEPGRTLAVWVADLGRNVARQRTVTLGTIRVLDWIEVRSGLNGGDRIIVSPTDGLQDGRRIQVTGDNGNGSH